MATFYYVSTLLAHGPQAIYKKDELIKTLNNFDYKPDSLKRICLPQHN